MLAFLNNMRIRISEGWTNFWLGVSNRFWSLMSWLREGGFWRQRQEGYTPAQATNPDDSIIISREEALDESTSSIEGAQLEKHPNAAPSSDIVLSEESQGRLVASLSYEESTLTPEEAALLKKAKDALKLLEATLVFSSNIEWLEKLFEQGKLTQQQVNDYFNAFYAQRAKYYQNVGGLSVVESLHMELLGDKTMTYDLYKKDLPRFEKQLQPLLKDYHPDNNPLPTEIEHIGQGEKAISIKRLQCRLTLVWIFIVEKMFTMYQKLENNAQENEKWGMKAEEARTSRIESERQLEEISNRLEEETRKTKELRKHVEEVLAERAATEVTKPKQGTVKTRLGILFNWASPAPSKSTDTLVESRRALSTENNRKTRNGEVNEDLPGSSFRRSNTK